MSTDTLNSFCCLSIFTVIFGTFALIIWSSNQRLAHEKGREPLYKETCSGSIGGVLYRGPFIKLRMYDDFLVIAFSDQILIHYDDIDEIVPFGNFLVDGTVIKHHDPNAPSRIRLSVHPTRVTAIFERYVRQRNKY